MRGFKFGKAKRWHILRRNMSGILVAHCGIREHYSKAEEVNYVGAGSIATGEAICKNCLRAEEGKTDGQDR